MFYAQFLLQKKGPLARIWLAAHWEKKLTKAQIYETDIDKAVDNILQPRVKMALRTTGHLLLGVVRIYQRKTVYLYGDCKETWHRMRLAFRPHAIMVDLPEDNDEAPYDAITYPEIFHDFDAAGMDISLNQGRYEEITMADVPMAPANDLYNSENAFGFGEEDEAEIRRDASLARERSALDEIGNLRGSGGRKESNENIGMDMFVDDINMGNEPFMPLDFMEAGNENQNAMANLAAAQSPIGQEPPAAVPAISPIPNERPPSAEARPSSVHGMTTLLSNPNDGFVLPPLDEATVLGMSRRRGAGKRRKRCLIIDQKKEFTPEEMKYQIENYEDTIQPLDLAPVTKKLMRMKESTSLEKLFSMPSIPIGKGIYEDVFKPNLKTRQHPEDVNPGIGITLADVNPDELPLEPVLEDPEMERDMAQQMEAERLDLPENNRSFMEPLPIILEEGETPKGNEENDQPLAFLDNVMASPFVAPAAVDLVGMENLEQPPAQRNSCTPVPEATSTPRRSPRKSRQSQQAENAEEDLDGSRSSQSSITWDVQARNIVDKLKDLAIWEPDAQIMFSDLNTGRDTRKTVARRFYAVLQLKKARAIDVKQDKSYGPITITTGSAFYA